MVLKMISFIVFYYFAIFTCGQCDEQFGPAKQCLQILSNISYFGLDYYWRDYHGQVPADAVPGGWDQNQKPTFIAQLYVFNQGILPARIYLNETYVTASRLGVYTSNSFIKVLCSLHPENFVWYQATAEDLHISFLGKHLIYGGTENDRILNIGRIQYQDELILGKVCGYNVGNAKFYFPYNGQEISSTTYEVLLYENVVNKNETNALNNL